MKYVSIWFLLFCALMCGQNALALGVPDSSFGFNGKINAGFGRGSDYFKFTAVAPDGSVIGLGQAGAGLSYKYVLAKFTPQGAPDVSFGNAGIVTLNLSNFNIPGLTFDPVGLVVMPNGFIYVAGGHGPDMSVGKYNAQGQLVQVYDGGETAFLLNGVARALTVEPDGSVLVAGYQGNEFRDYTIYKYTAAGPLDINFGNGGRSFAHMGWKGKPVSIVRDGSGKLLVTGWVIPENSPTPNLSQSLVARFNSNGSLDTSFGSTGVLISPVRAGRSEVFEKCVALKDGRVMAAGTSNVPNESFQRNYVFARFMSNGVPDRFFGARGTIISSFNAQNDYRYVFEYQNDGSLFIANEQSKIYKFTVDGGLDTSFGVQGVSTLNYINSVFAMGVAPDGKLIAGGALWKGSPINSTTNYDNDLLAVRINIDGSLDSSFDGDGAASRDAGNYPAYVNDIALQQDGKIVVVGNLTQVPSGVATYGTGVARYNPDGVQDISFGSTEPFFSNNISSLSTILGVEIQPDGKILVAGNLGLTGPSNSPGLKVIRFNSDGTLDGSFGSGGIFSYPVQGSNAFDIALQPDGKILLGGFNHSSDFMLVRLNSDGTFDPQLGGSGIVTTDISGWDGAVTMALQPNGKILLAGCSSQTGTDMSIVRYNANGVLDQTFGRRGKVITGFGIGSESCIRSIALTPNGNIVVSGYRRVIQNSSYVSNPVVAQYTGKGQLDNSFANGGIFAPSPMVGNYTLGQSVLVAGDGSILISGGFNQYVQVLRLSPTGVPDTAWGPNGFFNTGILDGNLHGPNSVLDSQGRLVISGTGGAGEGFVARFAVVD